MCDLYLCVWGWFRLFGCVWLGLMFAMAVRLQFDCLLLVVLVLRFALFWWVDLVYSNTVWIMPCVWVFVIALSWRFCVLDASGLWVSWWVGCWTDACLRITGWLR